MVIVHTHLLDQRNIDLVNLWQGIADKQVVLVLDDSLVEFQGKSDLLEAILGEDTKPDKSIK